jgi:hypothetical protein
MGDSETVGIDNQHGVRMLSVLGALGEVFELACYRDTDGINQLMLLKWWCHAHPRSRSAYRSGCPFCSRIT